MKKATGLTKMRRLRQLSISCPLRFASTLPARCGQRILLLMLSLTLMTPSMHVSMHCLHIPNQQNCPRVSRQRQLLQEKPTTPTSRRTWKVPAMRKTRQQRTSRIHCNTCFVFVKLVRFSNIVFVLCGSLHPHGSLVS